MSNESWLPSLAPSRIFSLAALLALLLVASTLWLAKHSPSLGLSFSGPGAYGGLQIETVSPGPAQGRLRPGDVLMALEDENGRRALLDHYIALEEPDTLPTFAEYNRFFDSQQRVWEMLSAPQTVALLGDGRRLTLMPTVHRPLSQLPASFWSTTLIGVVAWLLGIGVWAFRRGEIAARILAISGGGFMLGALSAAVYVSRELVLEPEWFRALAAVNHLGVMIFGYAACVLLWYYPRRLGRFPIAIPFIVIVALLWGNERLQLFDWPLHTFYLHFMLVFAVGACFGVRQWRATRNEPLGRAALSWWLLTTAISLGFTVVLFFVPVMLGSGSIASVAMTFGAAFLLYLGLALGILRYRLFDLDRWWMLAWLWMIGGLLVLLLDAVLMYLLHLAPGTALGMAVVLVGFVYFPLRQWLMGRLVLSSERRLENYFPRLVETLIASGDMQLRWQQLLKQVFEPAHLRPLTETYEATQLAGNGLALQVPYLSGEGVLELDVPEGGRRLYSPADVHLANSLLSLARQSLTLREQRLREVQRERERIMRDLHDDVGARLLTLAQRASNAQDETRARDALRALRETIFSLDADAEVALADVLADVRLDTGRRLESAGLQMHWDVPDGLDAVMLVPRQQVNLRRMLQEMISNVLKHADAADAVQVVTALQDGQLEVRVCDNGCPADASQWVLGRGLNNIRTRARELDGEAQWWGRNPQGGDFGGCCIAVRFPV